MKTEQDKTNRGTSEQSMLAAQKDKEGLGTLEAIRANLRQMNSLFYRMEQVRDEAQKLNGKYEAQYLRLATDYRLALSTMNDLLGL